MRKIFVFFMLLLCVNSVRANDSDRVILHYGSNIDYGYGGSGSTILTPYVVFPEQVIAPYVGNRITGVRIGLNADAKSVTVYIKNSPQDAAYIYYQKVGSLKKGWNDVILNTPYDITGEDVAIGYKGSFTADNPNGVGCSSESFANANLIMWNSQSKWVSVTGSNCIGAIIEGDKLPRNESSLKIFTTDYCTYDDSAEISGELRNWGVNAIDGYRLAYTKNCGDTVFVNIDKRIEVDARDTFSLVLPIDYKKNKLNLSVYSLNGQQDIYAYNNTDSVTITRYNEKFRKRVFVEEGTGSWCKFCVAGIVRLELLKESYKDLFVPACIHYDDEMQISVYDSINKTFSGFPECLVNRDVYCSDVYGSLEQYCKYYLNMEGHFGVTATGAFVGEDSSAVDVNVRMISDAVLENPNYRMFFVVLEDSVTGYKQLNGYAGGVSGYFYGWENRETYAECAYMDVARGVVNGLQGGVCTPEVMEADTYYNYSARLSLPSNVTRKGKVHIAIIVLDSEKGNVVNAYNLWPDAEEFMSVNDICEDSNIDVKGCGGYVSVTADGEFDVRMYAASGMMVRALKGCREKATVGTFGLHGTYIIQVIKKSGECKTYKMLL
ncbi:MAG: hypothetical protein K6E54_01320 [Bacteroidaceae bacterium]|nr:hypothetical protein [Bacteroidaceae bacterium]